MMSMKDFIVVDEKFLVWLLIRHRRDEPLAPFIVALLVYSSYFLFPYYKEGVVHFLKSFHKINFVITS